MKRLLSYFTAMDFKQIAGTMVLILILLFALTPLFTKRERNFSKLEGLYFEGIKNFKNGKISKELLIQLAKNLSTARGLNDDSAMSMVENDLDALVNIKK
jgi:hypothetical protein